MTNSIRVFYFARGIGGIATGEVAVGGYLPRTHSAQSQPGYNLGLKERP